MVTKPRYPICISLLRQDYDLMLEIKNNKITAIEIFRRGFIQEIGEDHDQRSPAYMGLKPKKSLLILWLHEGWLQRECPLHDSL